MTESRIAADILESGHLSYPEGAYYSPHSTITPVYNLLIAFSSSLLGSSTFLVAQYVAGMISLTAVLGAYLIALRMTSSPPAAFATSLVLALFGTFVFLTGSCWKESLGVSILMLLIYSYIQRDQPRMLAVMTVILLVLPFVHHLVTALAYLSLWLMTIWSTVFAARRGSLKLRHARDVAIMTITTVAAFVYYASNSFSRLSLFSEPRGILFGMATLSLMIAVTYWYLTKKSRMPMSFAPVPASALLAILLLDYFNPVFSYEQGSPPIILVLVFSMSVIAGLGWLGFEILVESNNRYRAVPLGLLLPVLLVIAYAFLMESGYWSHWLIYRTYDFSIIPLALGVGAVAKALFNKTWRKRLLMVVLLSALMLSFPFSYWTGALTGVRHDTQYHEFDAISWSYVHFGGGHSIRSDERLSYDAQALYDVFKDPSLPRTLSQFMVPESGKMNLFIEEWCTIGVNDYPEGHPTLDESYVQQLMSDSNVLYVGGPAGNNVVGFTT